MPVLTTDQLEDLQGSHLRREGAARLQVGRILRDFDDLASDVDQLLSLIAGHADELGRIVAIIGDRVASVRPAERDRAEALAVVTARHAAAAALLDQDHHQRRYR